jgi:putative copper resistance protein D
MMVGAALIVARFIHYTATLTLFGAALFPVYAGDEPAIRARISIWLRRCLALAGALALLSGAGWFLLTAASMAGNAPAALDPATLAMVARSTEFGALWIARLSLVVATLMIVLLIRRPGWVTLLAPMAGALAVASLAMTGHASEPGGWRGVAHAIADAAHLIAAGVWLGGLVPLARSLAFTSNDCGEAGRLLTRFSGVGIIAVGLLVISGVANSWFLVGTLGRLFATAYGRVLVVKIVLFLAMAGLAAANRFWIAPALAAPSPQDPRWLSRIRRHVAFEQALGLAVLAAVSVLGTIQPAIET